MHFYMVFYSSGQNVFHFYMVLYNLVSECIHFYMVFHSLGPGSVYFHMVFYSLVPESMQQTSSPFPKRISPSADQENIDFYSRQGGLPVLKYSTTGFEAFSQTITCNPLISRAS